MYDYSSIAMAPGMQPVPSMVAGERIKGQEQESSENPMTTQYFNYPVLFG